MGDASVRIQFLMSIGASALLLSACGGTGGILGDQPAKPLASELGDGSRLSEVIETAPWVDPKNVMSAGCAVPPTRNIFVTGVVVNAVDRFDETGTGALGTYYVQDASKLPLPYSGVDVFKPSFSPPDLRLAAGDVTDLLGVYEEFLGPSTFIFPDCKTLPELSGTLSFRAENGLAAPRVIPLADLKTYATARQWLGMLVRVQGDACKTDLDCPNSVCSIDAHCDIALYGASSSKGRFSANIAVNGGLQSDDPQISNELYDVESDGPVLPNGAHFKSITGIVTFFAQFHVAPRSPADFEP